MALAASGVLYLRSTTFGTDRSIEYEVEKGDVSTGPYTFQTAISNSEPSVGSLPVFFSDFYGFAQLVRGRLYGQVNIDGLTPARLYPLTTGGYDTISDNDTETLSYSDIVNQSCKMTKANGADWSAGDAVDLNIYRRTANTSGSWGTAVQTYLSYASESYLCNFESYDYLFYLTSGT